MTVSPANPVPPGQPVAVTLSAVDEAGAPWSGLFVQFVRSGDPESMTTLVTDGDGLASYVLEVEACAISETVTAVVRRPLDGDGTPVPGGIIEDLSTLIECGWCGGGDVMRCTPQPCSGSGLQGLNRDGGRTDVLWVSATPACDLTGATVIAQKRRAGAWVRAAHPLVVDTESRLRFAIPDPRPKRVTRYRVKLMPVHGAPGWISSVLWLR